jgi:rRNA maturation endonuclease Nob1
MSIELFVLSLTAFCGICFLCGFYIAKRIYKDKFDRGELWQVVCPGCKTVWNRKQPIVGYCTECGELLKDYYKIERRNK